MYFTRGLHISTPRLPLHEVRFGSHNLFRRETFNHTYRPYTDSRQRQPSNISQSFLVGIARECIAASNQGKTPKLVVTWARRFYGITISTHASWRALKELEEGSAYSLQKSYQYLQSYLDLFAANNPGTVTKVEHNEDNSFERMCIVYGVYNNTLRYCLPVIAIDVCNLRGADHGSLYVASTMTGAHDILILGVAISNAAECKADWTWFLEHLLRGLPCIIDLPGLFIISDRDKGITPSVRQVFRSVPHAACAEHIKRNVIEECKTRFDGLIIQLAKETDVKEIEDIYEEIGSHSELAVGYLKDVGDSLWISAFFRVPRFGIVTFNSAELVNNSIEDFRKGSHLMVVAGITQMVMKRAFDLKQKYDRHDAMGIIPSVMNKLDANKKAGRTRKVIPQADSIFNVERKNGLYRVVNLEANYCTCGLWDEYQYSCVHGCAALHKNHLSELTSVSPFYRYGCLQSIFAESMMPIDVDSAIADETTLPPVKYRGVGRPKKPKRIRSRGELIPEDSPIICSRCNKRGHNIRTCERRELLKERRQARNQMLKNRREAGSENEHKSENL